MSNRRKQKQKHKDIDMKSTKPVFIEDKNAKKLHDLDKEKDKILETLLSLYNNIQNEIHFRQKRGDDAVIPVYTLLIATLGVQALEKFFDINFISIILAIAIPLIALTGAQRGNQEHKMRAAAQGYASYLENQINLTLGSSMALWNIAYIERYIAKQVSKKKTTAKLKTSQLLTIAGTIMPVFLSAAIAFRTITEMHQSGVMLLWNIAHSLYVTYILSALYYIVMIIIICSECISFVSNETVRRTSAYFPIDEEIKIPARLMINDEGTPYSSRDV